MSSKEICIGILIFILVVIIIYVLVMFELYKKQKFIFTPYTSTNPPPKPSNSFYPLGSVTPMTQEEIDQRNSIIIGSTSSSAT